MVLLCCAVWFVLRRRGLDHRAVGLCYSRVVEERETWRLITSTVSHVSPVHLLVNASSVYNLGALESWLGSQVRARGGGCGEG